MTRTLSAVAFLLFATTFVVESVHASPVAEPAVVDAEEVAAAKANLQKLKDGEVEQTGCPFSGGKLDASKTVDVDGETVAFCCGGCEAKASKVSGDERLVLLFSPKAFEKAFSVKAE